MVYKKAMLALGTAAALLLPADARSSAELKMLQYLVSHFESALHFEIRQGTLLRTVCSLLLSIEESC